MLVLVFIFESSILVFWIRRSQGYHNRCLGFVNEARTMIHAPAGCLVQFHLTCRDERQTVPDVIDCFIRQGMAVAGPGVGILGNPCQHSLHDMQNAFFLGGFFVAHNGSFARGLIALSGIVTQMVGRGGLPALFLLFGLRVSAMLLVASFLYVDGLPGPASQALQRR